MARKLKVWLEELSPSEYKKAIYNNTKDGFQNRLEWSFEGGVTALQMAFNFSDAPEGREYWFNILEETFL